MYKILDACHTAFATDRRRMEKEKNHNGCHLNISPRCVKRAGNFQRVLHIYTTPTHISTHTRKHGTEHTWWYRAKLGEQGCLFRISCLPHYIFGNGWLGRAVGVIGTRDLPFTYIDARARGGTFGGARHRNRNRIKGGKTWYGRNVGFSVFCAGPSGMAELNGLIWHGYIVN